jgi:hypothetical protein
MGQRFVVGSAAATNSYSSLPDTRIGTFCGDVNAFNSTPSGNYSF